MPKRNSHPLSEQGVLSRFIEPCILVIFGASGDLTARKLFPALYNLAKENQLPSPFAVVGFARREKSHEQFRSEMKQAVKTFSRSQPLDETVWKNFEEQIYYHRSEFHDEKGYESLKTFLSSLDAKLGTKGNRVFYLSTQPSFFTSICEKMHKAELLHHAKGAKGKWSRVIVEKPFGHDFASARILQQELLKFLDEEQLYRIDHYLGKESVQNLLVFRFANSLFESIWNHKYIDHVQITVAEDMGIGSRGTLWEESGMLRDVVQNHVMQLLSLVAMEPPVNLSAHAIRDEKVKVLEAIRPLKEAEVHSSAVRGQYGEGYIGGSPVIGYRQENNVAKDSKVETYVAIRLFIDNWRWSGVPFYLRSGKRLPKKATEIAIIFRDPPGVLFQQLNRPNESNVLSIRIQPDEGMGLKINCKVPGPSSPVQPVKMDFRYGSYFGMSPPEAYERLIQDCILGDNTLFARDDEVLNSWKFLDPILKRWGSQSEKEFPNYQAGSWGPKAADQLLAQEGRKWRLI